MLQVAGISWDSVLYLISDYSTVLQAYSIGNSRFSLQQLLNLKMLSALALELAITSATVSFLQLLSYETNYTFITCTDKLQSHSICHCSVFRPTRKAGEHTYSPLAQIVPLL